TNLRATVATTVPNMVRGSLPLILRLYHWLVSLTGKELIAALYTGLIVMIIAIWAAAGSEETFGKDLNYVEQDTVAPTP
ncbi:MAG TPA: MFS transporter, partial [Flavisolibacter sp.]|nr:MFS transporter [Flavisolibacter sp.]